MSHPFGLHADYHKVVVGRSVGHGNDSLNELFFQLRDRSKGE